MYVCLSISCGNAVVTFKSLLAVAISVRELDCKSNVYFTVLPVILVGIGKCLRKMIAHVVSLH